jgi:hypothetical protein
MPLMNVKNPPVKLLVMLEVFSTFHSHGRLTETCKSTAAAFKTTNDLMNWLSEARFIGHVQLSETGKLIKNILVS